MTDIAALQAKYFLGAADAHPPSEPVPQTFADSKVTGIIDGQPYFDDLAGELATIGTGPDAAANDGHFILIASWWLGLAGGRYVPAATSPAGAVVGSVPLLGPVTPGGSAAPGVVNDVPLRLRPGDQPLIELLKTKARVGVDVRVLGWISFAVMGTVVAQLAGAGGIAQLNSMTMESVKSLRRESAIGAKAMLNVISHSAGAVHSKLVVLGTKDRAVAYTGGIDFVEDRRAEHPHQGNQRWHDVVAKVEGPGVQGPYDWFRAMWEEGRRHPVRKFKFEGDKMPSFLPGTPELKARAMPAPSAAVGSQHVQSLRTVPRFEYATINCLPENDPISFAPEGIFEFRAVVRKALRAATSLIYIEDQSFWSHEMLSWANEAIKAHAGLHVILLTSGAADPNDPSFPFSYFAKAINHGLLEGLTPAQRDRVRLFRLLGPELEGASPPISVVSVTPIAGTDRLSATTSILANGPVPTDKLELANLFLVSAGGVRYPVVGNAQAAANTAVTLTVEQPAGAPALGPGSFQASRGIGLTAHSKLTIVDDECAIVGSANCMRRSLYGDLEHSVAVLEEGDTPFAKRLRMDLWAHHLGGAASEYTDLQAALSKWDPSWGSGGSVGRPSTVRNWRLPVVPDQPLADEDKRKYDAYVDIDSRETWGGLCPP